MLKIMSTLTTSKMRQLINTISTICLLGVIFDSPSYALKSFNQTKGFGYSIITENKPTLKEQFEKNNWIRTRRKKIPCGAPNVVGIQSVSSALLIASKPQSIPDFKSCPIIRLS